MTEEGFRRIAPSPTSGKLIKLFAQRSWRSCGQIQERPTEGLLRQLSAHAGIVDTLHGVSKILPFQERMQLTASLRFAGCAFTSLTTNPLPINLKGMSSTAAVSTNGQNSCLRNQGAICQSLELPSVILPLVGIASSLTSSNLTLSVEAFVDQSHCGTERTDRFGRQP